MASLLSIFRLLLKIEKPELTNNSVLAFQRKKCAGRLLSVFTFKGRCGERETGVCQFPPVLNKKTLTFTNIFALLLPH